MESACCQRRTQVSPSRARSRSLTAPGIRHLPPQLPRRDRHPQQGIRPAHGDTRSSLRPQLQRRTRRALRRRQPTVHPQECDSRGGGIQVWLAHGCACPLDLAGLLHQVSQEHRRRPGRHEGAGLLSDIRSSAAEEERCGGVLGLAILELLDSSVCHQPDSGTAAHG